MPPEMPDVLPGEPIESSWGNLIRSRSAQRYTNTAQRDSLNPTPEDGDLAYLLDADQIQIFKTTDWRNILSDVGTGNDLIISGHFVSQGRVTGESGVRVGPNATPTGIFNDDGSLNAISVDVGPDGSGGSGGLAIGTDAGASHTRIYNDASGGKTVFRQGSIDIMELSQISPYGAIRGGIGSEDFPTFAFKDSFNMGMFRATSTAIGFVTAGVIRAQIGNTQFIVKEVSQFLAEDLKTSTTGNAANVNVATSNGRLIRSTSSLKYKDSIKNLGLKRSQKIISELQPITFKHTGDYDKGRHEDSGDPFVNQYAGFGAESVAEVFPEAGDDENYDLRAIVAALVRVVQDLL